MNKKEFVSYTQNNIHILDGATGSFLLAAGMPRGSCTEEWVCDHPETVISLQRQYLEAGSEIILAPTFGANAARLKTFGLQGRIEQLNTDAVRISQNAAQGRALVAGDISMTGEMLEPFGDMTFEKAVDIYKEQISILNKAGCDLLVVETMISIDEVRAAIAAANEVSSLPLMVTMTFDESGRTTYGTTAADAARIITDCGADAVGANCSYGPDRMLPIIEAMAGATRLPLIAKPNAGMPQTLPGGAVKYDLDEDAFASSMAGLINAGASLVGGCCGTTPAYIRKLYLRKEKMHVL